MATTTNGGFVTPAKGDYAAIPAAIGINNEVAEKRLGAIEKTTANVNAMLEAVPELFAKHLIDEDAYTIVVFYDYDNTAIGYLAVPNGQDVRGAVNDYVESNFIHPDLRNQTAEQLASLTRADSYRGEYPYTGPDENDPLKTGGENTVTDGAEYPLTNHLDYVFAGKDTDSDYPYVSGWVEVTPETIAETRTTLNRSETAKLGTEELPTVDWSNFAGGYGKRVIAVKAAYTAGENMNTPTTLYMLDEDTIKFMLATGLYTIALPSEACYNMSFKYVRVNSYGNGVASEHKYHVMVRFYTEQGDYATFEDVDVGDVINVSLMIPSIVTKFTVMLMSEGKETAFFANHRSAEKTFNMSDYILSGQWVKFLESAYGYAIGESDVSAPEQFYIDRNIKYHYVATTGKITEVKSSYISQIKKALKFFYTAAIAAGQINPYSYTWYQIQYAIIACKNEAKTVYLTPEEAETYCKTNYPWCADTAETGEE